MADLDTDPEDVLRGAGCFHPEPPEDPACAEPQVATSWTGGSRMGPCRACGRTGLRFVRGAAVICDKCGGVGEAPRRRADDRLRASWGIKR